MEVAAQQRAPAAGQIARGDPDRGIDHDRMRDQAALQTRVLVSLDLRDAKLLLDLVSVSPADRVADRPREQIAIDLALDEIVLRAGIDRGLARRLIVKPGQQDRKSTRLNS